MAQKLYEETNIQNIASAIRTKLKTTDKYKTSEMADAILSFTGDGSIDIDVYNSVIDRTVKEIHKSDFVGLTKIGRDAFYYCAKLSYADIPDTVEVIEDSAFHSCNSLKTVIMSKDIKSIGNNVFNNSLISEITFYQGPPSVVAGTFDSMKNLTTIYVAGELLDEYLVAPHWGTVFKKYLQPNSKYVGAVADVVLAYNTSKTITIPLTLYNEAPTDFSIISSDENITTVSNIVATAENISFDINALEITGNGTVMISVLGDNGHVFQREIKVSVFPELTESSYEVVPVEGAAYGFVLNDNGYWESTNQKKASSYSICQVNISNMMGRVMYVDCINYGEANYDFGILSNVNKTLKLDANADSVNVHYNLKGQSSPNVKTIEYLDAIGDCFIQIKFKKDGSGDQNNDSIQFQIRFAE
jgi:hypothetical protein